jgi:transposase
LGLVKAVVEDVEFDEAEECIVVSVRPRKATKRRCGHCGKRCSGYDQGEGSAAVAGSGLGHDPGVPGSGLAAGALS